MATKNSIIQKFSVCRCISPGRRRQDGCSEIAFDSVEHKLQAAYVALVAVVGQRFLWREPGVSLLASRASLRWRPTRELLLCSRNP